MYKTYEYQRMTVVVSALENVPALAVAGQGEVILSEIQNGCGIVEEFCDLEIPKEPGIYLWSGSIHIDDGHNGMGEPSDPDIVYLGKWQLVNRIPV